MDILTGFTVCLRIVITSNLINLLFIPIRMCDRGLFNNCGVCCDKLWYPLYLRRSISPTLSWMGKVLSTDHFLVSHQLGYFLFVSYYFNSPWTSKFYSLGIWMDVCPEFHFNHARSSLARYYLLY